jgi:hypothetical protein
VAESPRTLVQQGLQPLGPRRPQALARGMGPRGPALETGHALGIESAHYIAHGLFAAPDLARTPRHPGALLAGQHDLAAPHEKGIGGPESGLHLLALL